jgi:hypothetical protein
MKIAFTRAPTITKAVIATVLFTIVFLATNSNLPSCNDAVAALNAGQCIVRQSYLHTACGWLALVSLATGVVLFILKQRRASSLRQQAPSRPAWSEPPTAEAPSGSPGPERASNFCSRCGTRAVAGDSFCQQCGVPVKTEPEIYSAPDQSLTP